MIGPVLLKTILKDLAERITKLEEQVASLSDQLSQRSESP